MKKLILLTVSFAMVGVLALNAQENKALKTFNETYVKAADWLVSQQNEDGGWAAQDGNSDVAFTGLIIAAFAKAPTEIRTKYAAQIEKGTRYILTCVQDDGKIINKGRIPEMANYKTAIAVMALAAVDKEKYIKQIGKAVTYLKTTQWSEKTGVSEKDMNYGGFGYDKNGEKPKSDLSNTGMALDALHEAGVAKNDESWQKAVKFLNRVQNRTESNDLAVQLKKENITILEDGGFIYDPMQSKAGEINLPDGSKGLRSYGSMTYIGLKSFVYAFLDKKDPRVQAAYKWIQEHYTLEENPELEKKGWYYYFETFAKALNAYGEKTLKTPDGKEHFWAEELVNKLAQLQDKDGSWVNADPKWFEDFRPLVTAYCLIAMDECYTWLK